MKLSAVLAVMWASIGIASAAEIGATVQSAHRVNLATPVSGTIARVAADVGDAVKKDQVLLSLDDVPFKTRRAQAQAALVQAQVTRAEAKRDLAQAEELYRRTVLSTVELENAKNKYARADAAFNQAQAALTQAQYELNKSVLRAPFDALVVARNAEPGQTVAVALEPPVLMTLAARGEYVAQAQVAAANLPSIKNGDRLSVLVNGQRYPAKMRSVAATANNAAYELSVIFQTQESLRPGQAATIVLP